MKIQNQIFLAILAGLIAGLALNLLHVSPESYAILDWIGKLFIRLLKMVTVPLIVASLIVGVNHLKTGEKLREMGLKTLVFYLATTATAVIIGLILVNLIRPGIGLEGFAGEGTGAVPEFDRKPLGDMFLEFVPENIFSALVEMQFIPIILFSLVIGMILTSLKGKAKVVEDFFEAMNLVMLKLVDWIMLLAPVGVFALLASIVAKLGFSVFVSLGKYVATVFAGLLVHGFVVLPFILIFFARRSVFQYFRAMAPALGTAFSTASSAATLPLTMSRAEKEGKISNETAGFVLPLGATMNMDGTALYEAVAAVFISQVFGIALSFGDQLIIVLTATLSSIGAAAIPSAGLVTMAIVLKAVGLPLEGIALVVGVDRVLDMCRTTLNVWGDSVGAAVIDKSMKR